MPREPFQFISKRGKAKKASAFDSLSDEELDRHLRVNRYGDFLLTDAVRPSPALKIIPKTGFSFSFYHDDEDGDVPVVVCSASKEVLSDLLYDLLGLFPEIVDVVLETGPPNTTIGSGHRDLYREGIDLPVLKSVILDPDFEDLLLNDGCTGIAVIAPQIPMELQFEEHKLLVLYNYESVQKELMEIYKRHNIREDEDMKFIIDDDHVHSSSETYERTFVQLRERIGVDIDLT